MPAGKKNPTPFVSELRKPYKVFVSSTYLDNKERRQLVQKAITRAGMVWHGMEIFPASTAHTVDECLRYAREADVLVGIIAHRYGWEPEGVKSITEMEYDAAKERLMFLIDPSLPHTKEDYDTGPGRWKKQEKLEAFIERIKQGPMPALFREETLYGDVIDSLNKWRERREPRTHSAPPEPDAASVGRVEAGFKSEIHNYCRKTETLHASLPVAGFATRLKVPIDIEEIYVPLRAMLDLRGVVEEGCLPIRPMPKRCSAAATPASRSSCQRPSSRRRSAAFATS